MSRLKEIIDIVTANSEENVDDFLDLMKPDSHDRDEMSAIYEETLGYDPSSYFDKRELGNIADAIAGDPETPSAVVDAIGESKDDLVETAYNIFAEGRSAAFLPAAMEEAIEELTGIPVDIDVEEDEDEDDDDDYEMEDDDEDNEDDD